MTNEKYASPHVQQLDIEQSFDAIKTTLLSIYDQIILTDPNGTILSVFGEINRVWGNQQGSIITENLIELEKKFFYDDNRLENLLTKKNSTVLKTSWNEQKIMFNIWKSHGGIMTWTLKNISQSAHTNLRENDEQNDEAHLIESKAPFIIRNKKMKDIMSTIQMVAQVPTTVLLLGDSGVGKEVIAKTIHHTGKRKDEPFIAINCGAIPENLLESELFGYTDGAFSGAKKGGAPGKFELAHKGILFLDEIGEMPLNLQVKLLRVLQEKQVTRLGDSTSKNIDVQIVAATNQSLSKMVAEGKFREDLYYRLHVVPIHIPPLRERSEEIPYLVYHFQNKYNDMYNKNVTIKTDAVDLLTIYDWPGNVRQLENAVERIIVTSEQEIVSAIEIKDIVQIDTEEIKTPPVFDHIMPLSDAIEMIEEQLINMAMKKYNSMKLAAKALGVSQPTMSRKYKKIQNKHQKSNDSTNRKNILKDLLDSRLRSAAIATASIIKPEEVIELKNNFSESNPIFQKLQSNLTSIIKQESHFKWTFIFEILPDNRFRTLVADKEFVMKLGDIYDGPEEFVEVAKKALKGQVEVTPIYQDVFGAWKTTLAPIISNSNEIVALIGFDYSEDYVHTELRKLAKMLKINL